MKALWLLGLLVYIIADHLLTVGCYGFYHPYLYFSPDVFHSKFLLSGYSFISSPLDFEILAIIRSAALLAGIIYMWLKGRVTRLNYFFLGSGICNTSATLIKILAFSDLPDQLYYYGVWLNIVWNTLSFIIFYLLWRKGFIKAIAVDSAQPYEPLADASNSANGSAQRVNGGDVTGDGSVPREEEPKLRVSTFRLLLMIFSYCYLYWPWLLVGTVFLMIYSAGTYNIAITNHKFNCTAYCSKSLHTSLHGKGDSNGRDWHWQQSLPRIGCNYVRLNRHLDYFRRASWWVFHLRHFACD
jgi:hypothetical protein